MPVKLTYLPSERSEDPLLSVCIISPEPVHGHPLDAPEPDMFSDPMPLKLESFKSEHDPEPVPLPWKRESWHAKTADAPRGDTECELTVDGDTMPRKLWYLPSENDSDPQNTVLVISPEPMPQASLPNLEGDSRPRDFIAPSGDRIAEGQNKFGLGSG